VGASVSGECGRTYVAKDAAAGGGGYNMQHTNKHWLLFIASTFPYIPSPVQIYRGNVYIS